MLSRIGVVSPDGLGDRAGVHVCGQGVLLFCDTSGEGLERSLAVLAGILEEGVGS